MDYTEQFENFWLRYGSSDSLKTKGSKREAWKAWEKARLTWNKEESESGHEAFAQHVFRGYDAVLRNRRAAKKANQFTPSLPHVRTFLSQWRFEEEQVVSTSEYREMANHDDRICDCGESEVIGRSKRGGWICRKCDVAAWKAGETYMGIKPTVKNLVEQHPKHKDETWREWSIRVLATMPVGRKLLQRYGNPS